MLRVRRVERRAVSRLPHPRPEVARATVGRHIQAIPADVGLRGLLSLLVCLLLRFLVEEVRPRRPRTGLSVHAYISDIVVPQGERLGGISLRAYRAPITSSCTAR